MSAYTKNRFFTQNDRDNEHNINNSPSYFDSIPSVLSIPGGIPKNSREYLTACLGEFASSQQNAASHFKTKDTTFTENNNNFPEFPTTAKQLITTLQTKKIIRISFLLIIFWLFITYLFSTPLIWRIKLRTSTLNNLEKILNDQHNQINDMKQQISKFFQTLEELQRVSQLHVALAEKAQKETNNMRVELEMLFESRTNNNTEDLSKGVFNSMTQRLDELEIQFKSLNENVSQKVSNFQQKLLESNQELKNQSPKFQANITQDVNNYKHLENLVETIYNKVFFDSTRKIDWSNAALGGKVLREFTTAGLHRSFQYFLREYISSIFRRYRGRNPPISKPPEIIIGGGVYETMRARVDRQLIPGNCFAFEGGQANITLGLPAIISVEEIHIDHLPEQLLPSPNTAPFRFAVYVDSKPQTNMFLITSTPSLYVTTFEFNYTLGSSQTFLLPGKFNTRRIRFEFLKNHGGPYTCVYRLRVHGNRLQPVVVAPSHSSEL